MVLQESDTFALSLLAKNRFFLPITSTLKLIAFYLSENVTHLYISRELWDVQKLPRQKSFSTHQTSFSSYL